MIAAKMMFVIFFLGGGSNLGPGGGATLVSAGPDVTTQSAKHQDRPIRPFPHVTET